MVPTHDILRLEKGGNKFILKGTDASYHVCMYVEISKCL